MNYKLAKRLKEAGFPQREFGDGQKHWFKQGEEIYIPTLEELIDVCGDDFYELTQLLKETGYKKDEWIASGQGNCPQLVGKTKKEAVAKLWLKLNK